MLEEKAFSPLMLRDNSYLGIVKLSGMFCAPDRIVLDGNVVKMVAILLHWLTCDNHNLMAKCLNRRNIAGTDAN